MERADQFIGQSLAFLDAVERASRAAPLNRPVLVIGERGTGKELIAERLHHLSSRWAGPLIVMNCAALPENLIEAELFGHEAGSFTGAAKTRHGRFEEADGGTLFLDELGTLSMPAQDRLLRAVEYGEITRIGASKPISVDVRIVAATNENLPAQVDKGKFRADLLDRLSFEVITLAAAARAPGRHPAARRAFRAAHGGRARLAQLAGVQRRARWPRSRPITGRAMCASCATSSSARSIATKIPSGRSTRSSSIRSIRRGRRSGKPSCRAPIGGQRRRRGRGAAAAPARRPQPPVATNDFRGAVAAYERELLEDALRRNRFNQRATAAALGLSYDQLRHALKRHKLQDARRDPACANGRWSSPAASGSTARR